MLEMITADEVDLDGRALAVWYRPAPDESEMLLVSVAAHETEAEPEPASICTSELRLIVIEERMTKDSMLARVEAEAAGRGIERVAWIQER